MQDEVLEKIMTILWAGFICGDAHFRTASNGIEPPTAAIIGKALFRGTWRARIAVHSRLNTSFENSWCKQSDRVCRLFV